MKVIPALPALLLTSPAWARAQPLPLPKTGQCPSGYRESGAYCAPTFYRSPVAVPKQGQCPSGFAQSGAYCLKMGR
jgi:hypothetical protein